MVPDVHRPLATEVYSIDEVTSTGGFLDEPVALRAVLLARGTRGRARRRARPGTRRAGPRGRRTTRGPRSSSRSSIAGSTPRPPAAETMTVHVTCTNRDLPGRLPFGGEQGDFELEAQGPDQPGPLPAQADPAAAAPARPRRPVAADLAPGAQPPLAGRRRAGLEALRELLTDRGLRRQRRHPAADRRDHRGVEPADRRADGRGRPATRSASGWR